MDNAVVVPTGAGALADQAATRQPFYSMITSFMAHLHQPQQPAHRDVFCGHLTDWIKLLRATYPLPIKSSRPVSAAQCSYFVLRTISYVVARYSVGVVENCQVNATCSKQSPNKNANDVTFSSLLSAPTSV